MPFALDRLLVVSTDGAVIAVVEELSSRGRRAVIAEDIASALDELGALPLDVLLLDLDLGEKDPREAFTTFHSAASDVHIVLLASEGRVDDAAALVCAGAEDYVRKPLHVEELARALDRAAAKADAEADRPPASRMAPSPSMVSESPKMREVVELVRRAARGQATVLVRGETGSGKEVVARRIHELSPRAKRPFLKVHCAALPEQLLESELFGYEKGAFTGASSRKPGRLELAEGGTLFLDEIGDISAATQVKLLRVLQDRQYERLGGTKTVQADVRIITATHQNLEALVADGKFRQDLYYRINVISITAPPLREHAEDIPALVRKFALSAAEQNARPAPSIDDGALRLLARFHWPGNVRQLQNVVERLVVMSDADRITDSDARAELENVEASLGQDGKAKPANLEASATLLNDAVRKAERRAIEKALKRADGNRSVAARILGVSRRTLYYKLVEHNLGG